MHFKVDKLHQKLAWQQDKVELDNTITAWKHSGFIFRYDFDNMVCWPHIFWRKVQPNLFVSTLDDYPNPTFLHNDFLLVQILSHVKPTGFWIWQKIWCPIWRPEIEQTVVTIFALYALHPQTNFHDSGAELTQKRFCLTLGYSIYQYNLFCVRNRGSAILRWIPKQDGNFQWSSKYFEHRSAFLFHWCNKPKKWGANKQYSRSSRIDFYWNVNFHSCYSCCLFAWWSSKIDEEKVHKKNLKTQNTNYIGKDMLCQ